MQRLSDNFLSLVLFVVLVVSPVQNTIASINHTMTMANTEQSSELSSMQQNMPVAAKPVSSMTDMQGKHCPGHSSTQCHCDMSHCATVSFIMLPVTITSSLHVTHADFNLNTDSGLIQSVPSSLFRPPRV